MKKNQNLRIKMYTLNAIKYDSLISACYLDITIASIFFKFNFIFKYVFELTEPRRKLQVGSRYIIFVKI